MPAKLPAIRAVRKQSIVHQSAARVGYPMPEVIDITHQDFERIFQSLDTFPPQDAHGSGALAVAGMDSICPFGIAGLVAFLLQLAAELNKFGPFVSVAVVAFSEQAVCFWGVAHGCLGITLFIQ